MTTARHTYQSALDLIGVTVPDHLNPDAAVPVLTGAQAQGDLIVFPHTAPGKAGWKTVPDGGIQVVHGEATGNTHWLRQGVDSPDVEWARVDQDLTIGYLRVPAGQTALLLHTDEHGANAIGAGTYAVHGKRELADDIRRVAD